MRIAIAPIAVLGLLAGCGGGPTEAEENLSTTASHPEVTANSAAGATGMGDPSAATGTDRTRGGDTPGGPLSDQAGGQVGE